MDSPWVLAGGRIALAFQPKVCSLRLHVKAWISFRSPRKAGTAAVACLTLILWLWTLAFATFPQLHGILHHDAQNAGHICLISEMHQNSLLGGFSVSVVPIPALVTVPVQLSVNLCFSPAYQNLLPPGRAPPASVSQSEVVG